MKSNGRNDSLEFRPFQAGDEAAFRELNEAWIRAYFSMEDKDRQVLDNPAKYVLDPGGQIVMALRGEQAVGCCALLAMGESAFEVAKMSVSEDLRGHGIGRQLLVHTISHAKAIGAKRLYLETNTKLANAIHLYESVGFRHLPPDQVKPSPYARANVHMEMLL